MTKTLLTVREIEHLKKISKNIRRRVLKMIIHATASHIASSYSIVELLVYLYEHILDINPKKPHLLNQDKFILDKGWGVSALYALLAKKGFFDAKDLDTYCDNDSKYIGMATKNDIPGVDFSTGSIGHGLPLGIGVALAMRIKKIDKRVYVLIGDGGTDEGVIWESALIASHHKLNNLTAIIDYNKWQSFGRTNEVLNLEPLKSKWQSFNWNVVEIDGHNFTEIAMAIKEAHEEKKVPTMIIAHTVKGKGFSYIEDKNEYHYRTPREAELVIAKKEDLI